ncbi:MAG: glutamate synthase subunit beta [Candidatus Omnitrophica bacterium]|nr:glutamate synthase subunit beta [Candidatus Omnitrophota bacterium]
MPKDVKAFLKIKRRATQYRPVYERVKDYKPVVLFRNEEVAKEQTSRCMDCGVAFCHWACPLGNYIPEWNDAVLEGNWEKAFSLLNATNNLPEITGRVCPAPCEHSCVLGLNDDPVTICQNEFNIIEYAYKYGFIKAVPPKKRTGKKVAVIGSGPAGLSLAEQLNRAGHAVTVFERNQKCGGLMRYGIPDFKLEKNVLDRKLEILRKEGVEFKTKVDVCGDVSALKLTQEFDALVIAIGSGVARDLKIEGRDAEGIHFAIDYLGQSNRRISGEDIGNESLIDAKGKKVVVIGGGDTGSDCVGTANRQGARSVVQIEVMPRPSECRTADYPWPMYPLLLKSSSSHEEGVDRHWAILTKKFISSDGKLSKLACVRVEFVKEAGTCPLMREIEGSEFEIDVDMAILAIGFVGPQPEIIKELGLDCDSRGNIKTDENYLTSQKNVFSAGDARRGQSLIVWAVAEARRCAHSVDKYLMGKSCLPMI